MGRYAEAEALYEQAFEINKLALGEKHPDTAVTLYALARVRREMDRSAVAEALYEQTLEIFTATLADAHPHTILCLSSLAGCKASLGKLVEARPMMAAAMDAANSLTESSGLWTGRVYLKWAHGLSGAGLVSEAEDAARTARNLLAAALGPDASFTVEAEKLLKDLEER